MYDNIGILTPKNSSNINNNINSPSILKYILENLNSSEIKKRNIDSFLNREEKISFFDIDNENNKNDLTLSLKKSKINNNSNIKEDNDYTDKEIDRLITKIKEQNLKK